MQQQLHAETQQTDTGTMPTTAPVETTHHDEEIANGHQEISSDAEALVTTTADVESAPSTEHLLAAIRRHRRAQRLLRAGGFALGLPALMFCLASLMMFVPALSGNPVLQHLNSFLLTLTPFKYTGSADEFIAPNGVHFRGAMIHVDVITPLVLMIGCFAMAAVARSQHRKHSRLLARFGDLRAVGPLAQNLASEDRSVSESSAVALCVLLPRLQAGDTALLNAAQRASLHRALLGRDLVLSKAILKAFQQIGTATDLSAITRLADGTERGVDAQVRQAAAECLPFLRQQIEQSAARQTLLRAASNNSSGPEILLRPAQSAGATDPDLLLRPHQP